jgi:hypothetical protein
LRSTFEQTLLNSLHFIICYLSLCLQKIVIKKKKETIQQTKGTPTAVTQNVPVSLFADYTNFHMLLYPAAQLFMNPINSIILNKDNAEDKEVIKYF